MTPMTPNDPNDPNDSNDPNDPNDQMTQMTINDQRIAGAKLRKKLGSAGFAFDESGRKLISWNEYDSIITVSILI